AGARAVGELVRRYIDERPEGEESDDGLAVYQQQYPWFLGSALWLLTLASLTGGPRKPRKQRSFSLLPWRRPSKAAVRLADEVDSIQVEPTPESSDFVAGGAPPEASPVATSEPLSGSREVP